MRESTEQKKTPYLDIFHAVHVMFKTTKIVQKIWKTISCYGDYCNTRKLCHNYHLDNCSRSDCSWLLFFSITLQQIDLFSLVSNTSANFRFLVMPQIPLLSISKLTDVTLLSYFPGYDLLTLSLWSLSLLSLFPVKVTFILMFSGDRCLVIDVSILLFR